MQTEAQVASAEIERINAKLPKLIEFEDPFWAWIKSNSKAGMVSDRDMRVPLKVRTGAQYRQFNSDGGSLGRGGGPDYTHAIVSTVANTTAMEWSFKTGWATSSRRKAVINAVRDNMNDGLKEHNRAMDAQLVGDGSARLGTVGVVDTTAKTTTITGNFGVRRLRENNFYQVYSLSAGALSTYRGREQVLDVDDAGGILTWHTLPSGIASGDVLVVDGATDKSDSPTAVEAFLGVQYHHNSASTGTWLGINRATYPQIRGNSVDAGGAFHLKTVREVRNKVGNRLGKSAVKKMTAWMHPEQKDRYEGMAQLVSTIMKEPRGQKMDLYFGDGLQLAGSPIMTHYSWDNSRIDFMNRGLWHRAVMKELHMLKNGSNNIFPLYDTTDGGVLSAQISYYASQMQVWMDNPAMSCYISNT